MDPVRVTYAPLHPTPNAAFLFLCSEIRSEIELFMLTMTVVIQLFLFVKCLETLSCCCWRKTEVNGDLCLSSGHLEIVHEIVSFPVGSK